jgi:hypothetical protein
MGPHGFFVFNTAQTRDMIFFRRGSNAAPIRDMAWFRKGSARSKNFETMQIASFFDATSLKTSRKGMFLSVVVYAVKGIDRRAKWMGA